MQRQILTHTIKAEALRAELKFLIAHFIENGFREAEISFGYAWDRHYYSGKERTSERIELQKIEAKIFAVEATGIGKLGEDDLFIRLPHLEIQLCHDSDIHLRFDEPSEDTERLFERWQALGYRPSEWVRNADGRSSKVR